MFVDGDLELIHFLLRLETPPIKQCLNTYSAVFSVPFGFLDLSFLLLRERLRLLVIVNS